jgi:hypothetical protein
MHKNLDPKLQPANPKSAHILFEFDRLPSLPASNGKSLNKHSTTLKNITHNIKIHVLILKMTISFDSMIKKKSNYNMIQMFHVTSSESYTSRDNFFQYQHIPFETFKIAIIKLLNYKPSIFNRDKI